MSVIYPVLAEASFNCEKSGHERFLPDVGQRSRATIPGDDPGDQQPSEWRGFNPDPHTIDGMLGALRPRPVFSHSLRTGGRIRYFK